MPIYAYRCDDCGFAKDVVQKISNLPRDARDKPNEPAVMSEIVISETKP